MSILSDNRMIDRIGTVAIAIAAIVAMATGAWAFSQKVHFDPSADPRMTLVVDWRDYASNGGRLGPDSAPVQITVFTDYTCPKCREAMQELEHLRKDWADELAVVIRHFPLSNGVPRDAAIAAECGRRMGRFEEMHRRLVLDFDSLGSRAWEDIAADAGIGDSATFLSCVSDTTTMAVIARDLREGIRLGVFGTPSFLANQYYFVGTPPREVLRRLVSHLAVTSRDGGLR